MEIERREFPSMPQAKAWMARQGFRPVPGRLSLWEEPGGLSATHETTAWRSVRVRVFDDAEINEDDHGRGIEPPETPDCQPSNPDECPVCRGGRCRGEPS